ncbi:MAG: TetR/AcrR family transcriptional regulator [Oscillospiraceae bacterium]|nr:TetR/AcrR family transcriptional regulator [Oscillospiraceae bacterium]
MDTDDKILRNDRPAYKDGMNDNSTSDGTGADGGNSAMGGMNDDITSDGTGADSGNITKGGTNADTPTTKQRILNSAANLFATKGYTETSIRELAAATGLQGSSIYNHFISKSAILEYMLDDYVKANSGAYAYEYTRKNLEEDPTTDGILKCLQLTFTGERAEYYFKVLCMIMQEQHRNIIVNDYVRGNIRQAEDHTDIIITVLKDLNIIRRDTDPDFWKKIVSSLFYTFSNRAILGNGDSSPGFSGMGMVDLLRDLFDKMLLLCGVDK